MGTGIIFFSLLLLFFSSYGKLNLSKQLRPLHRSQYDLSSGKQFAWQRPTEYHCNIHRNYFPVRPSFRYSSTIKNVQYTKKSVSFEIVTTEGVIRKFEIVKRGCTSESVDTSTQVIFTNPTAYFASSTPIIGLLQGLLQSVEAFRYTSSSQYIFSPVIQEAIGQGRIVDLPSNNYTAIEDDDEVGVVFLGGFQVSTYEESGTNKPYILVNEVEEETPLGRLEYLKLFGLIFDVVCEAVRKFSDIERRYIDIQEESQRANSQPTVFFNYPFGESWTQPGKSQYIPAFIRDANGRYVDGDVGEQSQSFSLQEIVDNFSQTDILLNSALFPLTNSATLEEYVLANGEQYSQYMRELRAVQSAQVWSNSFLISENGKSSDFFESGAFRPDLVLLDYAKILHPDIFKDTELTYMYKYPGVDTT